MSEFDNSDETGLNKAQADGGTVLKQAEGFDGAPAHKTLSAEPPIEPLADPDADKIETIGDDRTGILLRQAEAARQAAAELAKPLDAMKAERDALDAKIKEQGDEVVKLETVAKEAVAQISQADMVKRIQAQTGERLVAEANARKKLAEALGPAGVGKQFASPLDAALASGAKRSTVLVDGKPFQAPHPRSPEGVRAYAGWIHNGSQRPA